MDLNLPDFSNLINNFSIGISEGILLLLIAVILSSLLILVVLQDRLETYSREIKEIIRKTAEPIDVSSETKDFIELATEVWRLKGKIKDIQNKKNLSDETQKALFHAVQKINRLLKEKGVVIKDYEGRKYNEGMNIEVLELKEVDDKDSVEDSIIIETIAPEITVEGQIAKQAKVIVSKY